eukprot:TRINITY_DN743_c3_g1_i1.p1 TRINITY_DN743_c3_g1~~TRINITY_DN743_c3_g1_i1.p1  ORF type:complete len:357 (-),score=73.86 TRINITY_DN743_c3_g1_i1:82-1152(-)
MDPRSSRDRLIIEANGVSYECVGRSGKGSFGVVYKAISTDNTVVAIKRVLQDPRYKNRELQIMKIIVHPNCVRLLNSFYERSKGEVFLNLVLPYVPRNLYEVCMSYVKNDERMPIYHIKLYIYQLCRSLSYVHSLGICHRDIKPQNMLIDPDTQMLKLCDFGSAKILIKGAPNVPYICSRYYRAPELIFGAEDYTTAIDIWSSGCVMAELILGEPIFAGESRINQLVEIIKVLGTPSREEMAKMSPNDDDYKPTIKPYPWSKVFPASTPELAVDVVKKMLVYTPSDRLRTLETCTHPFFDEIRHRHLTEKGDYPGSTLPLFEFTTEELSYARAHNLLDKLMPRSPPTSSATSNESV